MTRDEFNEVLALIGDVTSQDHKVGSALRSLLHHVAVLAGVDTQQEESAPTEAPATEEK